MQKSHKDQLRIYSETAKELGFQYIVTMNEDDTFKEKEEGFNLKDYVVPVKSKVTL